MNISYKNLFDFGIEWNYKTVAGLLLLAIFPNLLGLFHYQILGINIHFFQILIFLAAIIYGPKGGIVSGAFGSVYIAMLLSNPYIIIGNMILGGAAGFLIQKNWHVILAVLTAYGIQLPWLWVTDIYLVGMPQAIVSGIVIALLISNVIWAFVAWLTARKIKTLLVK